MPGASSRTTGSATRWNSLTPLFMRHGSDQPFRVTTGLYGRPIGGRGGGCVAAPFMLTASGKEAAPTRLTSPAPTANTPVFLKKSRRDTMNAILSSVFLPGLRGGLGCHLHGAAAAAIDRVLHVRVGNPKVTLCLDCGVHAIDLVARV